MTRERITVTVPPGTTAALRAIAGDNVSAFVQAAIEDRLSRVAALQELESIMGGPPTRDQVNAVRDRLGLDPLEERGEDLAS